MDTEATIGGHLIGKSGQMAMQANKNKGIWHATPTAGTLRAVMGEPRAIVQFECAGT